MVLLMMQPALIVLLGASPFTSFSGVQNTMQPALLLYIYRTARPTLLHARAAALRKSTRASAQCMHAWSTGRHLGEQLLAFFGRDGGGVVDHGRRGHHAGQ